MTATYNAERQKIYNRRAREKKAMIKRISRELDAAIEALERLPKCCACQSPGAQCDHTTQRKLYTIEAAIARSQLAEAEY
jgi:hypothetical protein